MSRPAVLNGRAGTSADLSYSRRLGESPRRGALGGVVVGEQLVGEGGVLRRGPTA